MISPRQIKPQRIQKVMAHHGLGSRRQIEEWIKAGRITLNGVVAKLGDVMGDSDKIEFDKRQIAHQSIKNDKLKTRVIAYHKPVGEICTRQDPDGRKTVFSKLPPLKAGRWIGVGRLDINTIGLLLFTNDGDLAHRLMHPSSVIDREYAVRVLGQVDDEMLKKMQEGVALEDGVARFSNIVYSGGEGANHWYHVTLMQGRNRQVKRIWATQGITISRLIRVRFGPILLPRRSRPGTIRELDQGELKVIYQWLARSGELAKSGTTSLVQKATDKKTRARDRR